MTFPIGTGDRVVVVGHTGSGKTTLTRRMVGGLSSLVVIDPKYRFWLPPDPRRAPAQVVTGARAFAQVWPHRALRVIYRPDLNDARHGDVNDVMARILNVGRTCLLVNEAMDYANATTILPAYRQCVVRGREAEVRVISETQRPTGVHNTVLSEAEHFFLFYLMLQTDRHKMAGLMGEEVEAPMAQDYSFLYRGPATGAVVRCQPLVVADLHPAAAAQ